MAGQNFKTMRRMRLALEPSCHYCDQDAATVDHIIPRSSGGPDASWNLVSACLRCNRNKASAWPDCECHRCSDARERFVSYALTPPDPPKPLRGPTRKTFGSRAYWRAVARGYEPEIENAEQVIW